MRRRRFRCVITGKVHTTSGPQFDFTPTSREEIQEPFVRENEIDPKLYYPEGYMPYLLPEWPVEGDLVIPIEMAPENMTEGMGEA